MADPIPGNTPEEYATEGALKKELKPIVDILDKTEGVTNELLLETLDRFRTEGDIIDADVVYTVESFSSELRRMVLEEHVS